MVHRRTGVAGSEVDETNSTTATGHRQGYNAFRNTIHSTSVGRAMFDDFSSLTVNTSPSVPLNRRSLCSETNRVNCSLVPPECDEGVGGRLVEMLGTWSVGEHESRLIEFLPGQETN
jgi:hypothetical protein